MTLRLLWALALAILSFGLASGSVAAGNGDVDREVVTIWSEGVRLEGDIFKPSGLSAAAKLPGILLVHGWGGTKSHLNQAYAPQLAKLGFIVLTFDFKGWGKSDGPLWLSSPLPATEKAADVSVDARHVRLIVDPLSQLEDARAALHYLAGEPQLRSDTIGVWGTSLGGGLALVTAATNDRVKALVSQIGAVNNKANFADFPDSEVSKYEIMRARGEIPAYPGPESGVPGLQGYPDLVRMKRYDPAAYWDQLNMPTLVIDAESEELFDREKNGGALYAALKDRVASRYLVLPGKHYDIYRADGYQRALKAAQDWFVVHLQGQ